MLEKRDRHRGRRALAAVPRWRLAPKKASPNPVIPAMPGHVQDRRRREGRVVGRIAGRVIGHGGVRHGARRARGRRMCAVEARARHPRKSWESDHWCCAPGGLQRECRSARRCSRRLVPELEVEDLWRCLDVFTAPTFVRNVRPRSRGSEKIAHAGFVGVRRETRRRPRPEASRPRRRRMSGCRPVADLRGRRAIRFDAKRPRRRCPAPNWGGHGVDNQAPSFVRHPAPAECLDGRVAAAPREDEPSGLRPRGRSGFSRATSVTRRSRRRRGRGRRPGATRLYTSRETSR